MYMDKSVKKPRESAQVVRGRGVVMLQTLRTFTENLRRRTAENFGTRQVTCVRYRSKSHSKTIGGVTTMCYCEMYMSTPSKPT